MCIRDRQNDAREYDVYCKRLDMVIRKTADHYMDNWLLLLLLLGLLW